MTWEIIIGLATVIIGTLVADSYEARRNRPIVEASSTTAGDRLGFSLKVRRRSLNHPRILFYGGYTRSEWQGDLHPCDLCDENGDPYKEDFVIAGGLPVCIFPLVVKREREELGDKVKFTIHVIDPKFTYRDFITQEIPPIPKNLNGALSYPREPTPSNDKYATIRILAEGLERVEIQRFYVALETIVSGYLSGDSESSFNFGHRLIVKREPRLWMFH